MIVYVKNNHGVRQLENIDNVVLDKEGNAIVGYFDYPEINGKIESDIAFIINFEGEYNEKVKLCYSKIQDALENRKDSCLIHIYE